jgi:hypothetical protein
MGCGFEGTKRILAEWNSSVRSDEMCGFCTTYLRALLSLFLTSSFTRSPTPSTRTFAFFDFQV